MLLRHRTGALGHLERHVPDDVGVEDGDGQAGEDRAHAVGARGDRHHPGRVEPAYLLGHRLRRLARSEAHPLRQGLVREAERIGTRSHLTIMARTPCGCLGAGLRRTG